MSDNLLERDGGRGGVNESLESFQFGKLARKMEVC